MGGESKEHSIGRVGGGGQKKLGQGETSHLQKPWSKKKQAPEKETRSEKGGTGRKKVEIHLARGFSKATHQGGWESRKKRGPGRIGFTAVPIGGKAGRQTGVKEPGKGKGTSKKNLK